MSAPHFFAGAPEVGEVLTLTGDDARHAVRSLRLVPGDAVTSSDGAGALSAGLITSAGRDRVEAEIEDRTVEPPPAPRLIVMMAAPKGDRLTWGVQKLTEIGVDEIVVLESERSVRRWEGERAERVADRLTTVVHEAAKQSRRRFLPRVGGPQPWDEALAAGLQAGSVIVLWEEATVPLFELMPDPVPAAITLMVGPEGGIAEEEAEAARVGGALLASLGSTILRTETAALVGSSIALAVTGRLG